MSISPELAKAFDAQIGHEFGASLHGPAIAALFSERSLTLLAKLFQHKLEKRRSTR